MNQSTFAACLSETLRWEGGFSHDPHDPGGPTNRGITLRVFAAWRRVPLTTETSGELVAQLRAIPPGDVAGIYRAQYWDQVRGDELPSAVAQAVFDFAVNSGATRACRHLQAVLGCAVDGHIGAVTLTTLQDRDALEVALAVNERRRAFLRQLPHFWRFGRGWLNRVDGIDAACRRLAPKPAAPTAPPVAGAWITEIATPLPDADAQSALQGRATVADKATSTSGATAPAAGVFGATGGVQLGVDVAGAAAKAQAGGLMPFALELAQRPSFWLALAAIGGAVWVWLDRRRLQITL